MAPISNLDCVVCQPACTRRPSTCGACIATLFSLPPRRSMSLSMMNICTNLTHADNRWWCWSMCQRFEDSFWNDTWRTSNGRLRDLNWSVDIPAVRFVLTCGLCRAIIGGGTRRTARWAWSRRTSCCCTSSSGWRWRGWRCRSSTHLISDLLHAFQKVMRGGDNWLAPRSLSLYPTRSAAPVGGRVARSPWAIFRYLRQKTHFSCCMHPGCSKSLFSWYSVNVQIFVIKGRDARLLWSAIKMLTEWVSFTCISASAAI